jgi:hypothetical protein
VNLARRLILQKVILVIALLHFTRPGPASAWRRWSPGRATLPVTLVPARRHRWPGLCCRGLASGRSAQIRLHLRYWCRVRASYPHVNDRYSPARPATRSRDKSCKHTDEPRTSKSWVSERRPGRVGAKKQLRCSCRCPFSGHPRGNFRRGSNNSGQMGGLRNGDRLVRADTQEGRAGTQRA